MIAIPNLSRQPFPSCKAEQRTCPLLALPIELIKIILSLGDVKDRQVLLTCRRIYAIGFNLKEPVKSGNPENLLRDAIQYWVRLPPHRNHFGLSLLRYTKIDRTKFIGLACQCGSLDLVNELLKDSKVDPSANDNWAIIAASQYGHWQVIKRLLKDKRVDPSARNNWSIMAAVHLNYLKAVKELLKDARVDPSARDNIAIIEASKWGNLEMVKELLKNPGVDPSAQNNAAIKWAYRHGNLKIVKELRKDKRVERECLIL